MSVFNTYFSVMSSDSVCFDSQVVRRIEVSPYDRMENLSNLLRGSANGSELSIPCGNFSRQYACMCDYYNLPYREEVAWVTETTLHDQLN